MKALLLCAGLGTRLRPLTLKTPKCLLPIAGRPLVDYWLDSLFASDHIDHVLINVHYKEDQFFDHLSTSPYKDRITIVFEPEILGTAGTLIGNKQFFADSPDVLLIHGDNFYTGHIDELINAHKSRPDICQMTMMLFEAARPETCGIVNVDDTGIVTEFFEKQENPPGNLANSAIYCLSHELLFSLDEKLSDFSLEVIPDHMGQIYSVRTVGDVIDIGTPETYAQVQDLMEARTA
jgi:mannose-1-phosphate guanylyltransferase